MERTGSVTLVPHLLLFDDVGYGGALLHSADDGLLSGMTVYLPGTEIRTYHIVAAPNLSLGTGNYSLRVQAGTSSPETPGLTPPPFAGGGAGGGGGGVWSVTDQPVAAGNADRTWMWGPEPITDYMAEPYMGASLENAHLEQTVDGNRWVIYFDKARMELTDPNADPNSIWYVTNGLLVTELVTGRLQLGNNSFEQRQVANINVAGDADDSSGPTYASMAKVFGSGPLSAGSAISQRIDRNGNITQDAALTGSGVTAAYRDEVTNHTIASPFWSFMNSTGTVYQDGQYITGPLFPTPFYATGRPITEAYWAHVKVGGTRQDVLMQCFERRCLTYTPDNPPGWQVEAGNVGRHYYEWRYGHAPSTPNPSPSPGSGLVDEKIVFASERDGNLEVYIMSANGSSQVRLTSNIAFDGSPDLSPDGSKIAFVSRRDGDLEIYVMNTDGSNIIKRTSNEVNDTSPNWSPDGSKIAFESYRDGESEIYVMNADGSDQTRLTYIQEHAHAPAWSPHGSKIAFDIYWGYSDLYVMNADGSNQTKLADDAGSPSWSSDGSKIAFDSVEVQSNGGSISDIYVMNANGTDLNLIVSSEGSDFTPAWSSGGDKIAFVSTRNSHWDIYIVNPDGSGLTRLTSAQGNDVSPAW